MFRRKLLGLVLRMLIWGIIVLVGFNAILRLLFPLHYRPLLEKYGQKYDVDPLLLAAVIRAESKFFPRAESQVGALGLMQIVPETGAWAANEMGLVGFDLDKLFDPAINIEVGAWYLHGLFEEFDDNLVLALAAYNSGRGNVRRWLENKKQEGTELTLLDLPYPETKSYVRKVLRNYHWYQRIYR